MVQGDRDGFFVPGERSGRKEVSLLRDIITAALEKKV